MSLAKKLNLLDGMPAALTGKPRGVDLGDVTTTRSASAGAAIVFVTSLRTA